MSAPLSPVRLAEARALLRYESSIAFYSARAKESMLLVLAEAEEAARLRAERDEAVQSAVDGMREAWTSEVLLLQGDIRRLRDQQRAHPSRAAVLREAAAWLREITTPFHGRERTEHERGQMYAARRLDEQADVAEMGETGGAR